MKTERNPNDPRGRAAHPAPSELALLALAFLADDEERAGRFLALTGLDGADIQNLLGEVAFHLAVLDHLAGDEQLLLAFADAHELPPEAVGRARRALGGGDDQMTFI